MTSALFLQEVFLLLLLPLFLPSPPTIICLFSTTLLKSPQVLMSPLKIFGTSHAPADGIMGHVSFWETGHFLVAEVIEVIP